jgi:acyl carrier protein
MHIGVKDRGGKLLLERPRRRWEDNIKMHRRELGWDSMDLIDIADDKGN